MTNLNWVDQVEKASDADKSKDYFNIVEGDNRFQVLSHIPPLVQKWDNATKRYAILSEGDNQEGRSIKGVCWVLQDGVVKLAKLPYTVVKAIRELQTTEESAFEEFPMPYQINVKAKNAGTKEVEYTVIASRKETEVTKETLDELDKKPSPEEMIEKMKTKRDEAKTATSTKPAYPSNFEEPAF